MSLVPCPDCDNQVSSEAWACPKCGRPIRGQHYGRRATIALIAMIVAVVAITAIMNRPRSPTSWRRGDHRPSVQ